MSKREVLSITKKNQPYSIAPSAVKLSFMMTSTKTVQAHGLENIKHSIDACQSLLNPELWPMVNEIMPNIPTHAIFSRDCDPSHLLVALKELGVKDSDSVFMIPAIFSFDEGQTQDKVFVGFVFEEDSPKLIVSNIKCLPSI